ncbi:MAG: hypothetical protein J7621_21505 [Niastella sp.]|nr:hypothetical protein [Niastella sp.]
MPKQKGTHRLLGTTGDMTYQKTQDGYTAREKTHINGDKIRTSDAYARTRENMAEFGRSGKASKLLRAALSKLIKNGADTRMTSRLTGTFSRIIKTDPVNDRGQRVVTEGNILLLEAFDFNINAALITTFATPVSSTINRTTGVCTVNISAVILSEIVTAPEGTTHLRIVTGAAELDFEREHYISAFSASSDLPVSNVETPALTLTAQVTAQSQLPLFLVMGVQFIQVVNGKVYPLKNGAFNPLTIVKIDAPLSEEI